MRTKAWVLSLLRGINATAVGLVFTAVYRLWEIGYLTPESSNGKSLADEPWWVVVAALACGDHRWCCSGPGLVWSRWAVKISTIDLGRGKQNAIKSNTVLWVCGHSTHSALTPTNKHQSSGMMYVLFSLKTILHHLTSS
jgi:hypothetical protein